MAENEVTPVKLGHLYYPRTGSTHRSASLAQRVGPTRFSRTSYGFNLDSRGIGSWSEQEIAACFRPAPELGSEWRPKGASYYIPRTVSVAGETVIRTESAAGSATYEPGAFFDSFEPVPPAKPAKPADFCGFLRDCCYPDTRAALLEEIDTFAARDDEDDLTEALDLNDKIQAVIDVNTNRGKCEAVKLARTALENAVEDYDAQEDGGIAAAAPVVVAVDALIAACKAAR